MGANEIDINAPVVQGEDVVINIDGRTYIGHYDEYDAKIASGEAINTNPDYNKPKTFQPKQPLDDESSGTPKPFGVKNFTGHYVEETKKTPKRDEKGHFVKN